MVEGEGVIGRDPEAPDAQARVVRLDDPGKTISKTHLRFGLADGSLWVEDLGSTNGTRVFALLGGVTPLEPGQRLSVGVGETVQFGDRYFTVEDH